MKLIDVLKPEYIKIPLTGNTKEAVIRELIDVLAPHAIFESREQVFQAVIEREKIMTTGVGNGVAIPHCKHDSCSDFAIALGIHPDGVDFDSIDNQPAFLIFLLVGPEDKPGLHIRLLSRISRIISKPDVRQRLLSQTSPEAIHTILKEEESKFFEIAG